MKYLKIILKDMMEKIDDLHAKQENVTMVEVATYTEIEREFNLPCQSVAELTDLDERAADISTKDRLVNITILVICSSLT